MDHTALDRAQSGPQKIWFVLCALNERPNLEVLLPELLAVADREGLDAHVVVVDDGSTDGTAQFVTRLGEGDSRVSVRRHPANVGKSLALRTGFRLALAADADVIVMMDADGQDDPAEVPLLLAKLADGADLVTGARASRQDRFVKRWTSKLYNAVTRFVSKTPGTDNNSGLKAMTPAVARTLVPMLYGEFHRYLTVIAYRRGFQIDEVAVSHRPRSHGNSKYGVARFWRGFVDLFSIRLLLDYERRPSHLFAGVGLITSAAGTVILVWMLIDKIMGQSIGARPLLTAGVLMFLAGLQLLFFGFLSELVVVGRQRDSAWSDDA